LRGERERDPGGEKGAGRFEDDIGWSKGKAEDRGPKGKMGGGVWGDTPARPSANLAWGKLRKKKGAKPKRETTSENKTKGKGRQGKRTDREKSRESWAGKYIL